MGPGAAAPTRTRASMTTARLPILGAVLSVALAFVWQPPRATMARGGALTGKPVTSNHAVPAASQRVVRPGRHRHQGPHNRGSHEYRTRVLQHPPGRPHGPWITVALAQGRAAVLQTNVRRRPSRTPARRSSSRPRRLPRIAPRVSPPRIPVAPAPTCAVVECAPLAAIHWAATRWGTSEPTLVAVARCESGLNPQAYNAGGGFSGLFQFLPATYWGYAPLAGETRSYWSASGSANVAAWMFAHGLAHQWGCA
jgi:hypothetical protein